MDLIVRRAEPEDHAGIWRIFCDESAYSGTLQLPHASRDLWRKRLTEGRPGDYMFVACAGDELVGFAGLYAMGSSPRRAHALGVGMAVPSAWQGKGVGTLLLDNLTQFADGWLNVFRLELTVYTDNARAIALYRKAGFEDEGMHRAYALRDGVYVDALAMARMRPKAP